MPPNPTRSLRLGRSFRKTVSIYPRSAPVRGLENLASQVMAAFSNKLKLQLGVFRVYF